MYKSQAYGFAIKYIFEIITRLLLDIDIDLFWEIKGVICLFFMPLLFSKCQDQRIDRTVIDISINSHLKKVGFGFQVQENPNLSGFKIIFSFKNRCLWCIYFQITWILMHTSQYKGLLLISTIIISFQ